MLEKELPLWPTLRKLLMGFAVIFLLSLLLGTFFKEPIQAFGGMLVARFGLPGLSAIILFLDSVPTPLSGVPFMLLALAGGAPFWTVYLIAAFSSYAAGLMGYSFGRVVGIPKRLATWLDQKHPRIRQLLDQYGGWGVLVIAILPLPLALGTLSAGALKVRPGPVALALLVRFPKAFVYMLMLEGGLKLGG